jgi:hypothetical protein
MMSPLHRFVIGVVPATLRVSGKFRASVTLETGATLRASFGGITSSNTWTAGMVYDGTSVKPTVGKSFAVSNSQPYFTATGYGSVTPAIHMDTKLDFVAAGGLLSLSTIVTLSPSINLYFDAEWCGNGAYVGVALSYRLDASLTVNPIGFMYMNFNLGFLPWSTSFEILPGNPPLVAPRALACSRQGLLSSVRAAVVTRVLVVVTVPHDER